MVYLAILGPGCARTEKTDSKKTDGKSKEPKSTPEERLERALKDPEVKKLIENYGIDTKESIAMNPLNGASYNSFAPNKKYEIYIFPNLTEKEMIEKLKIGIIYIDRGPRFMPKPSAASEARAQRKLKVALNDKDVKKLVETYKIDVEKKIGFTNNIYPRSYIAKGEQSSIILCSFITADEMIKELIVRIPEYAQSRAQPQQK